MVYNTIAVQLIGGHEFLKDALVSACHFYSESKIKGDSAVLLYHSETKDRDQAIDEVQESINLSQLENLGVELVSIC